MKDRLKSIRTSKGYSQPEMADKLGIETNTYKGYEYKTKNLPDKLLYALVTELNVNLNFLITGQGPMFSLSKTDKQQKYEHAFSERNTFGKRLNYYQAEENLTDKELAKILKTTESRIEQLGCDEKEPTLQELKELKLHSGVSIDLWIFGADNESASGCILNLSEDERKMLEFLKKAKENKLI